MGDLSGLDVDEINQLVTWLGENNLNTTNFRQPAIKHSLRYIYPLYIFLNAVMVIFGTIANGAMICVIVRHKLYKNPTYAYLANIAFSDILKLLIVVPLTVSHMLLKNWIFGSFMCFFLPMMHSFPIHATMLTYVMIGADRYRLVMYPMKSRLPTGVCLICTWIVAVCVVLPYAVFIKYIDIGMFFDKFDGFGLCIVNMEIQIEEYIRAMFVTLYCLPLAVIAFLYVKVAAEIKVFTDQEDDSDETTRCIEGNDINRNCNSRLTFQSLTDSINNPECLSPPPLSPARVFRPMNQLSVKSSHSTSLETTSEHGRDIANRSRHGSSRSSRAEQEKRDLMVRSGNASVRSTRSTCERTTLSPSPHNSFRSTRTVETAPSEADHASEQEEIDLKVEKQTQKYVITMVILFAACWCPINLLNIIYNFVYENPDNKGAFDITYATFTFCGFLSTCTNPVLFAKWKMPPGKREQLWKYFNFSVNKEEQVSLQRESINNQQLEMTSQGDKRYAEVYSPSQTPPESESVQKSSE